MLYIMRHGKTDWNVQKKLQGRTDIPLNAEGRAMAEKAFAECEKIKFDVCFCSPLKRAAETAGIVLKNRNVPIIIDARLTEMSFGKYEGLAAADKIPENIKTLFTSPRDYLPDGGAESFEDLFSRTGRFLDEAVMPLMEQNKTVLIVGHGAMNASIICGIKGIPLENFWSALTENCTLLRLI